MEACIRVLAPGLNRAVKHHKRNYYFEILFTLGPDSGRRWRYLGGYWDYNGISDIRPDTGGYFRS